jgi:hypothetical protein
VDYPLENLGPERFQLLCQALLAREHRGVQCFPVAQPDGGRDALYYPSTTDSDKFVVFQVKFARRPLTEADPRKWLIAIVEGELPKVKTLILRGAMQYVVMTNVPGTAHPDAGSIDKLNQEMSDKLGVSSICLWRDDINRRLDDAWSLKWTYPELMTGPDFLRAIVESGLTEHRERRASTIRAFLRAQYDMDEEVRFKQVELQNKLVDLFIDVPIVLRHQQLEPKQIAMFRAIFQSVPQVFDSEEETPPYDRSNQESGTVGAATLLLSNRLQSAMPRLVIEGAPGQGKSTIAQYVCQVHRMRLLHETETISCIAADHRELPVRLPLKVDLRDLATWMAKRNPFSVDDQATPPSSWHKSLESFLAALISNQSGGTQFNTDDLLAVLRISAVLVVFDGLDEVADITRRAEVVDEIVKGVQRLEENAASLQVVVTSRPAAFANSPGMPHGKYPHMQLLSLTRPIIMLYAEKWLNARRLDSKQGAEFRAVLKDKLDQPHLRDLARNPMQLAILLSLILTRGASLPDKRTALYDYYIDLFFSREAEKSVVVRSHRELLIDIHRYLAWLLHSEAELGHARASIAHERLQRVVAEYLLKEGHDPALAKELFTGMVERVVALVSRVEGTFEFEVQPLREYFAACHLYYTAPQSSPGKEKPGSKPDRFDAIARNFFWLNVTRFYAGCYSKGELSSLVERLQELAHENGFRDISYPRMLATTLLADWVFAQNPKSVQHAVDLIFDGAGFRYLTAQLGDEMLSLEAVNISALPPKCGRDELIRKCLDLLEQNLPDDYQGEVLQLARLNGENGVALVEPWIEGYMQQSQPLDQHRWLEYGSKLGVLSVIDLERLKQLVDRPRPNTSAVNILFRARRLDYLHESELLFNEVINSILDRRAPTSFSIRRVESPLDALNAAVEPYRYGMVFADRQPMPLGEMLVRRGVGSKLSWSAELSTGTEAYKNHQPCVELARLAEELLQRSSMEWATEIDPWDRLIEAGRASWGDRWVFFCLANFAGGIRSSSERCSEYVELLDGSKSLARRARYARLRSGANVWWRKQIESATSVPEKLLVLLISLTWATPNTLIESLDQLDEQLAKLPTGIWLRLFYAVRHAFKAVRGSEGGTADFAIEQLPETLPIRMAAIFMMRGDEAVSKHIFQKWVANSAEEDPIILEFVQKEALDPNRFGRNDWSPNLEAIRRCYKLGESGEFGALHRTVRHKVMGGIPQHIAEIVTAEPMHYPGFLVAVAEEARRQLVASRVVPVAAVAERDRWFVTT